MEQENKKSEPKNAAKASAESQSSAEKEQRLMKARSKVAKTVAKNFLKTKETQGTSKILRKISKNQSSSSLEGNIQAEKKDSTVLNARREIQKSDTISDEATVKSQKIQRSQEHVSVSDNTNEKTGPSNDGNQKRKNEDKLGSSNKNKKNKQESSGREKGQQNEKREKLILEKNQEKKAVHESIEKRGKHEKEKVGDKEERENKEKREKYKKEKLGGLIFMCNSKTKPDCFRYRVMGMSSNKKDLVLGVRPGLKLFLYDFDLKLMYGIYKASSSGGTKLEPKAFGGAFPVQVRFKVHADCYPLGENIFKKAIKENYYENYKFRTELTANQVQKLTALFRPVAIRSNAPPIHFASTAVRPHKGPRCVEAYDVRGSRTHFGGQISDRDFHSIGSSGHHNILHHEREQQIAKRELTSMENREISCDLYLNEKEYRLYGLQGNRRNSTPQHHSPRLAPYQRDNNRELLLKQRGPPHGEHVPMQRESIHANSLYLTERDYETYSRGARPDNWSRDPIANISGTVSAALETCERDLNYTRQYGSLYADPLQPSRRDSYPSENDPIRRREYRSLYADPMQLSRRETYPSETDPLRRKESDPVDQPFSSYALNDLSDNLHRYRSIRPEAGAAASVYQDVKPEAASTSVSSRYSFAGPSLCYR